MSIGVVGGGGGRHTDTLVLVTLGFKARVDSLLPCFLTSAQWISQIHH